MLVGGRADAAHLKLAAWMEPFSLSFTAPTWQHVLVLIAGAILSPGRRTVAAALRVIGLDQDSCFTNYHRVLNRNRWSSRRVARCLLRLLVGRFVPDGPVIIGLDDTLERRWGAKIKARGIYRDPVRSSHGHFVKASGLRGAVARIRRWRGGLGQRRTLSLSLISGMHLAVQAEPGPPSPHSKAEAQGDELGRV